MFNNAFNLLSFISVYKRFYYESAVTKQVECKHAETLKADIDGYTQGCRRETELQTKENQLEAPKLLKEEHTENFHCPRFGKIWVSKHTLHTVCFETKV